MDEVTVLLTIKVYLLFAPSETVTASMVKYPTLNAFSSVLQHSETLVRRQCVKILQQIYRVDRDQISIPFIHATSPVVIRLLLRSDVKKVESMEMLGLHSDALETLEILIVKSHPDKRLLEIYIPILVNLLLDDPSSSVTSPAQKQHDMALARLTRIGKQFPEDLKRVLNSETQLKSRVEQAVLRNQEQERLKLQARQQQQQVVTQPSIKLKTDFSNFT